MQHPYMQLALYAVVVVVCLFRKTPFVTITFTKGAKVDQKDWDRVFQAVSKDVLTIETIPADKLVVLLEMAQEEINRRQQREIEAAAVQAAKYIEDVVEGDNEDTLAVFGTPTVVKE